MMAFTFEEVSTYTVFLYGGPDGNSGAEAAVSLVIPDGWVFLRFYPQDSTLPPNKTAPHISGKTLYYLNYRYDQLANSIDILRNEKPIKFFYRDDTHAGYITTAAEPVGEEETP
ncbi:MAG: hypothetical protein AAF481_16480 [Acidobacteriota bacterium]